ncbi:xyloglucan endotransglucosylase/hydrolase protein 2-like [Cornus florida]|uniref:xyloglucan endotransglucosylase/hydrolase protein 2-like n=1 Tax=Cornus florida TaxID=4283 RepID=UPI00289CDABC|nr:xyloglucan endotransglucosylase/hydrolase protein 2-like [Cornus florida]
MHLNKLRDSTGKKLVEYIEINSWLFFTRMEGGKYASEVDEVNFDQNYYVTWGSNHAIVLDEGKTVQLLIDEYSGGGYSSKQDYVSGHFGMRMKIPKKNSKGVITTFYLTSVPVNQQASNYHDEIDFEFLGNNGMPYTLHTNVFASDNGGREQEFHLWFDPTEDFHTYEILWNQHQIVFFVDKVPIRVFKNNTNIGVNFPSQSMHIEASIWNSTSWQGDVDWSKGPFTAFYQAFKIHGCPYQSSNPHMCYSLALPWNGEDWQLNPQQRAILGDVRKNYMTYDYCSQRSQNYPECSS